MIIAYMFQEVLNISGYSRLRFPSVELKPLGKQSRQLDATLAIRGIERPVQGILAIEKREGIIIAISGRNVVRFHQHRIRIPKVTVEAIGIKDEATIEFKLSALPASESE